MPTANVFTGPNGSDPVGYIVKIEKAIQPTAGDCLYAGQIFRTLVRQRTARGVDADGSPFAPYSPAYAKRKAKRLGHANTVDLFGGDHHPHMLNAMQVRVGGARLDDNEQASSDAGSNAEHIDLFYVGFWDRESATRARLHNEGGTVRTRQGTGKKGDVKFGHGIRLQKRGGRPTFEMPVRRFFAANPHDLEQMGAALAERKELRLQTLGLRKS
jgi:hypothetical protein